MYSLTISFGPSATAWALLFKEEKKAGVIYNAYVDNKINDAGRGILIGTDDYGQSFAIPFEEIRGMILEDLDQSEEARIQRSLGEARLRAKLEQRASSDPVIRQAARGPAVLSPVPGGGFRQ